MPSFCNIWILRNPIVAQGDCGVEINVSSNMADI